METYRLMMLFERLPIPLFMITVIPALWKTIAILNRSMAQQRLVHTKLELVTFNDDVIWWHMPLGVQEQVKIYLKMKDESKVG